VIPDEWPSDLILFLQRTWGAVRAVEALGGLSGARVWRLDDGPRFGVVKQCRVSEAAFYERLAPTLRAAGIGVPELWWSGQDSAGHWLLMEYLPAVALRSSWLANPAWMRALARLHCLPATGLADLPSPFRPPDLAGLAGAAAEMVPAPRRPAFRDHLAAIERSVQDLELVPISGDPNPSNWGLRVDGQAVLFDWERIGLGPAAFDLAITMPGLGSIDEARQIAHAYLAARDGREPDKVTAQVLAQAIARCKVWAVAEFMAAMMERGVELAPVYARLYEAVPDWAARIAVDPPAQAPY
jgi:aminoglycoside phosphotransferase (APT) family kinase protein